MDHWGIAVNILFKSVGYFSPIHCWFELSIITTVCHGTRHFKVHKAQRWLPSSYSSDKEGPQWKTTPIPCPAKLCLVQLHSLGASVWSLHAFHMYWVTWAKACKERWASLTCSDQPQRFIFQHNFTLRRVQVIKAETSRTGLIAA